MGRKTWVVGNKRKGISLEDMARKKGRHSWYLKYWKGGRMIRQAEAISHAKSRACMKWYD